MLSDFGDVRSRAMFGGHGIYHDGVVRQDLGGDLARPEPVREERNNVRFTNLRVGGIGFEPTTSAV